MQGNANQYAWHLLKVYNDMRAERPAAAAGDASWLDGLNDLPTGEREEEAARRLIAHALRGQAANCDAPVYRAVANGMR